MSVEAKIAERRADVLDGHAIAFDSAIRRCESPIEALLMAELLAQHWADDRALTLAGWKVLRFTGSEVYADPTDVTSKIALVCYQDDCARYAAWMKGRLP